MDNLVQIFSTNSTGLGVWALMFAASLAGGVIASISFSVIFASCNAFLATLEIASIWFLEAISGTTPPYFSCIGIWVSIIFDSISLPFFTIATEVSSQLVSIPHC